MRKISRTNRFSLQPRCTALKLLLRSNRQSDFPAHCTKDKSLEHPPNKPTILSKMTRELYGLGLQEFRPRREFPAPITVTVISCLVKKCLPSPIRLRISLFGHWRLRWSGMAFCLPVKPIMDHTCEHCGGQIVGNAYRVTSDMLDMVVCSLCFMEAKRLHLHAEEIDISKQPSARNRGSHHHRLGIF